MSTPERPQGGRKSHAAKYGGVMAGILALGLGFAAMTQVHQNEHAGLTNLSQADLVALLANVNDQSDRLSSQLDDLRQSKAKLANGGNGAALADAQQRKTQLDILNGSVKVKGPGITISITNSGHQVTAANLLDAIEELRDAGAESINVGGHRVIASTWFSDQGNNPGVGGATLPTSFTITAIGDPHTMSTAMAIPGGVTDTLSQAGAKVAVNETQHAMISSTIAQTH